MKYRAHHFSISMENDQNKLEQFLNDLEGEVVSLIPNIRKIEIFLMFGISDKINFLLTVEKTE